MTARQVRAVRVSEETIARWQEVAAALGVTQTELAREQIVSATEPPEMLSVLDRRGQVPAPLLLRVESEPDSVRLVVAGSAEGHEDVEVWRGESWAAALAYLASLWPLLEVHLPLRVHPEPK